MLKHDVIRLVLEGKRPPYVPWSMGFTKEAKAKLQRHYGRDDIEGPLENHLLKLGSDIGFFSDLGNDRVKDVFGVVWDRSVDKDHLSNSRTIFLKLVEKVRSFPEDVSRQCIADRDYEGLELAVLQHLMGK